MGLINIQELPELPEKMNWDYAIHSGKLEPLKKPCKDCAITTGFYLDHADLLKLEPIEIQTKILDNWFCHNNCKRACAGLVEYLNK